MYLRSMMMMMPFICSCRNEKYRIDVCGSTRYLLTWIHVSVNMLLLLGVQCNAWLTHVSFRLMPPTPPATALANLAGGCARRCRL